MPQKYSLGKITVLTFSLCKLHDHCTDERENPCFQQTKADAFRSAVNGSITMDSDNDGDVLVSKIAHGREQFDDFYCRQVVCNNLPREKMIAVVRNEDFHRQIKLP